MYRKKTKQFLSTQQIRDWTLTLTLVAVVLVTSSSTRHLAWVGGAVHVSTRASLALVKTFLSLSVTLAVLVVRPLTSRTAGLVAS